MSEKKSMLDVDPQTGPPATASASASSLLDLPPSYDTTESKPAPQLEQDDQIQAPEDLPILVIDDCQIYSAYAPTRILYRLSNPVCDAHRSVYGIEKFRYRVDNSSDDPKLKHSVDHIYDITRDMRLHNLPTMQLKSFASSKRTYKGVIITDHTKLAGGYVVKDEQGETKREEELLKTERPFRDLLNQGRGNSVEWKDASGQVIAVETKLQRDKDKKVVELPRLVIKATIDEKLYDLLVTSWCAVVWRESKNDLKESLTWEKFKKTGSLMSKGAPGIWGGFGSEARSRFYID